VKVSFNQELGKKWCLAGGALSVHRCPDNVFFASPLWHCERKTEGAMPNPALRSTLFF
jgi:hypothetical protein